MSGHNGNHQRNSNGRQANRDLSKLVNGSPPHSLEAECALIGSMILDWRVIGDVLQAIKSPEDLYSQKHAAIYEALVNIYEKAQCLDMVVLKDHLAERDILEQVGGLDYLIELAESVPSAASAVYYAGIVADRARKRELAQAGAEIIESAFGPGDAADLVDAAEARIFGIATDSVTGGASGGGGDGIGAILQDAYDALQTEEGNRPGLETGFYELDEMTNGLQPGELIIVAARPSMGKTAWCMNIAEHVGVATRQPCVFFSMEMSRKQLGTRMMCARAGVDSHKLRRNTLTQEDFAQLALTVGEISESPLLIDDTPGLSLMQLRAKCRRLAARHDIQAVFIDYLQLMSAAKAESRQVAVSDLSRGLKQLARELNVPMVVLAQLNRQVENRSDNRPRMSDLRESGSIEQDADVVMLLHREDYYHQNEPNYPRTDEAEVIVAKQRNGPTGVVKLLWDARCTRFKNMAYGSQTEPAGTWGE